MDLKCTEIYEVKRVAGEIATIRCRMYLPGEEAQGIAIRATDEFQGEYLGFKIAHGRAMKALANEMTTGRITHPKAIERMRAAGVRYLYNSYYCDYMAKEVI